MMLSIVFTFLLDLLVNHRSNEINTAITNYVVTKKAKPYNFICPHISNLWSPSYVQ